MNQLQRASRGRRVAAAVVVGLALCVVPATAQASPTRTVCVRFRATGTGDDHGGGSTTGDLSVGRHHVATTSAQFTFGSTSASGTEFTGPLTISPDRLPGATLVAELDGSVDLTTGHFAARSTSLTGSGALRKVSGRLRVEGDELPDLTFTETLVGRLCAPVGGRRSLDRAVG